MHITLTSDIENALVEYAGHQGVSPEILALEVLRERFIRCITKHPAKEKESLTKRRQIMAEQAKKLVKQIISRRLRIAMNGSQETLLNIKRGEN